MQEKKITANGCSIEKVGGEVEKLPNPDEETTTVMWECATKMTNIMLDYKVPALDVTVEDDYGNAVTMGFRILRVHDADEYNRPGREL